MNQTNRNMLEGPLFPNITRFTIPIILTSVLQLLFNAAEDDPHVNGGEGQYGIRCPHHDKKRLGVGKAGDRQDRAA